MPDEFLANFIQMYIDVRNNIKNALNTPAPSQRKKIENEATQLKSNQIISLLIFFFVVYLG